MAQNQVAELVCEGAVPGRQSTLDEEHVAVGVLTPLTTHADRKFFHGDLDGPATVFADSVDEARQRHFPTTRCEIEHRVHCARDATTG